MKKSNKQYVLQTVTAALLIALKIVLERLMSYSVWNQRFGFAFLRWRLLRQCSARRGRWRWLASAIFWALCFFRAALISPGFTLTAVLTAACTAFFIHKNATLLRVTLSVIINQLFGSVLLNSLWISVLYGKGYIALLPGRIIQQDIAVLQIVLTFLLFGEKSPIRQRLSKFFNI